MRSSTKNVVAVGLFATVASIGMGMSARADDALGRRQQPALTRHKHAPSPLERERARTWNHAHPVRVHQLEVQRLTGWKVSRPFSEVEATSFVAISGEDDFELPDLREAMAKNLPAGVTLIVYVSDTSRVDALKRAYAPYLGEDRLKFLMVPSGGDPIWARDSLPFPVVLESAGTSAPTFGLVASIYPQNFDPNAAVQKAFSWQMVRTNQYFRGGNLLIDGQSNCFAENVNEVAGLDDPQAFFTDYFGCKTATLLDPEGGIGDIDERIKFLDGQVALTDDATYERLLTSKGYTVHTIPSTGDDMETYMNTLIVNGTVFVPQMGIARDAQALDAYRAVGLKPVGVYAKALADDGEGNIHCVTANYPAGTFTDSTTHGRDFVEFAGAPSVP
jgi:hypothetical protein